MKYELPAKETLRRIIKGPDGLDYLIALEGWYWNSLDWMDDHTEIWRAKTLIDIAWNSAKKMESNGTMEYPGNFVREFTLGLRLSIGQQMDELIAREEAEAAKAAP